MSLRFRRKSDFDCIAWFACGRASGCQSTTISDSEGKGCTRFNSSGYSQGEERRFSLRFRRNCIGTWAFVIHIRSHGAAALLRESLGIRKCNTIRYKVLEGNRRVKCPSLTFLQVLVILLLLSASKSCHRDRYLNSIMSILSTKIQCPEIHVTRRVV